jgi:RNA polymerase sigma-70 factor (ECF subfamily)
VEAAARGDHDAFGRLYERFGRAVYSMLVARVPRDIAEDLVQDVFLNAYRRLGDLREPSAFGGWICAMARRRAIDYYRRHRTTEPLSSAMPSRDRPDVIADSRRVIALIHTLPESYRETLVLRLVEGYSGPEIAELTGLSPGSVRVNLHRGFRLLRDKLGVAP